MKPNENEQKHAIIVGNVESETEEDIRKNL